MTANGYQIELYVIQETAMGKSDDIMIPTYGIKVRIEAIKPNRNGCGTPIINSPILFNNPTIK